MGNVIRCCCPEEEGREESSVQSGNATSVPFNVERRSGRRRNVDSDTTPLLQSEGGPEHSSTFGAKSSSLAASDHLDQQGGAGDGNLGTSKADSHQSTSAVVSEDQKRLIGIVLDSASKIFDCSMTAFPVASSQALVPHDGNGAISDVGLAVSSSAATLPSGVPKDPSEQQERARLYGKRLSAASKSLSQKHLKSSNANCVMVDVGAMSDGDKMMNTTDANELLSEADHVLANEVCSRVRETLDNDGFTNDEDIMRFDEKDVVAVAFGKSNTLVDTSA